MVKKTFANPVINELKGSAWFRRVDEEKSPAVAKITSQSPQTNEKRNERKSVRNTVRNDDRSDFRTENRSVQRSVLLDELRPTKRHSFEFFVDQIEKLDELGKQVKKGKRRLNKSAVLRAALDEYFKNHDL